MAIRSRDTKAILLTIERSSLRSSLFWWMFDHHDDIVRTSEHRRIAWSSFCAEATKRGLTDTRGQPVTVVNARRTWRRARKFVAKGRVSEAAAAVPEHADVTTS